ncbi:hypothetical protein JHS3_05840 [Jeongeupia sp. HS-3]|uniref:Csu type fimbrial protein n=1 Tax=Jeongeupia sp. HS-3 TaxID=1009682 RepID=UPI0018A44E6A|nr:spore coat protein U domain-containing protein [Jeongeupia sp. HS-3]BCL74848.1 hypothetical protein JHS3_05840 [Jeongeupia sp. HS-3]
MKKGICWVIGATMLAMAAGGAYAADKNVQVKAKVEGTCQFVDANDVVIDFGTLTPGGGDQSKSAGTSFWCTNGVNYTVALDNGLNPDGSSKRQMKGATDTDLIGYTLTADNTTGAGTGSSTPIPVLLTAGVKGTDYQDAKIGDYNDTVIMTLDLAP